MPKKIGTETVQFVIYTKLLDLSDKINIADHLKKIKSVDFNGQPTILPIPDDAPSEIPRIILRSNDARFTLNVAIGRIDVIFSENKVVDGLPVSDLSGSRKLLDQVIKELYKITSESFSLKVARVALVVRQIIKLNKSSKEFLEEVFLKENKPRPYEIRLAYLYKESLDGLEINKWKRVDTLRNKDKVEDDQAVAITFDINTVPKAEYNFDEKTVDKFYNVSMDLIAKDCESLIK